MFADHKASGIIALLLSLYFGSVNNFVTNTLQMRVFKQSFCSLHNTQYKVSIYSCLGFTIDRNHYPVNIGISQTARFTVDEVRLMCLVVSFCVSLSCYSQRTLCITYKEHRDILRLTGMHEVLHVKCLLFEVQ